MKKKFSKILGVGLTLALLASFLVMGAPVLADVSQPTVSLSGDEEISETGVEYTMVFRINKELLADDTITVKFPEDTDVAAATVANVTGVTFTSGIGHDSGYATPGTLVKSTDDLTVEIPLASFTGTTGIGDMAYVQVVIGGITNPTDTGTYTLEVKTNEEDVYVESEEYEIGIPVVGGFVYVYNPSNILLATFGGQGALNAAQDGGTDYYAGDDYTIMVGPGSYTLDEIITITGAGLTLESSEGAEDTIIDASTETLAIKVEAAEVTVDGFTIEADGGDGIWCYTTAEDAIIQNNVFTFDSAGTGINLASPTGVTVSGNELSENAYMILHGSDCTVSENTFGDIFNFWAEPGQTVEGVEITDNIFLANEDANFGIQIRGDTGTEVVDDTLIEGNTFDTRVKGGILISADETVTVTNLTIRGNDIINSEGAGIRIYSDTTWGDGNVIKFNTITGNEDYGIQNDITDKTIDATFNWWGTTDADEIDVDGLVTYEPFLTDTAAAAIVDGAAATNTSSLDAKTECGVKVSGVEDNDGTGTHRADVISAFEYAANPEEAIDDAMAFYDVYVALGEDIVLDEVDATLKFYDTAITSGSTVKWWTGDFWDDCSDQEARAGLVWVTVTEDTAPSLEELEGTVFVVVAGEAVAEGLTAPVLATPASGADDVSLTPIFAWEAVTEADGYYFEFADNANFVLPLAKMDGDTGRLIVTAYAYVAELPYSTPYYWRVKAVSGTAAGGDLEESGWASGVFFTMDEPVEPTPPIVIEPAPELPDIIITQPDIIVESPDVIVPLPAETPITPGWIYVIIAVGAVLVIALLVLIVRTRRVA